MNKIRIILLFFILSASSCADSQGNATQDKKYTISECIVLVDFSFNEKYSSLVANGLTDAFISAYNDGLKIIAGFTPPNNTNSYEKAYFQLNDQCGSKTKIIVQFLDNYLDEKIKALVEYHVSDEIVRPGLDTINIKPNNSTNQ